MSSQFAATILVIVGSLATINHMLYWTAQGKLPLYWQALIVAAGPLVLGWVANRYLDCLPH